MTGCGFLFMALSIVMIVMALAFGIAFLFVRNYIMKMVYAGIMVFILTMV